jgi:hypothetical protein
MNQSMKSSSFVVPTTLWASALLAFSLAFACGTVDPADNQPNSGGNQNVSGDGSGATAGGGTDAGGSDGGGSGGGAELEPLLPWAVGNSWTYQVTKDGITTLKTTTVGELEAVSGTGPNAELMAYHVTTAKGVDAMDRTESWQAPDADNPQRILRFREQSFGAMTGKLQLEEHWEPAKLHIDGSAERTFTGANWLESYSETKLEVGFQPTTHDVRERWTVLGDDETVEVPYGTFDHAIHFQKAGGGSTKEYWYVRGVGKVKETGSQIEELSDYEIVAGTP